MLLKIFPPPHLPPQELFQVPRTFFPSSINPVFLMENNFPPLSFLHHTDNFSRIQHSFLCALFSLLSSFTARSFLITETFLFCLACDGKIFRKYVASDSRGIFDFAVSLHFFRWLFFHSRLLTKLSWFSSFYKRTSYSSVFIVFFHTHFSPQLVLRLFRKGGWIYLNCVKFPSRKRELSDSPTPFSLRIFR